jgi:hypothetical protein
VLERANMTEDAVAGLRGDLSKIPLTSLLSFAEPERRAGVLQLEHEGERATLHLRDGAVMRIDLGDKYNHLKGIDRFMHVLDWRSGRFELSSVEVVAEDVLQLPTSFVLIELARRHDEQSQ